MVPLIVNTSDPMARVRVVTTREYSTETLKTLHTAGVLHVEESEELKPVDREAIERERRKVDDLLTNINDVLAYVPPGERVELKDDVEVIYTRPLDEVASEVKALCIRLGNIHRRLTRLNQELEEATELERYLSPIGESLDIRLSDLSFSGSLLFSRVFILPNETYEGLYQAITGRLLESFAIALENEAILYAIGRVEDQEPIGTAVRSRSGKILRIPEADLTVREFLGRAGDDIRGLEEEKAKLEAEIQSKTRENLERLVLFREALSAETERLAVLAKACESKRVTLVQGWIPEDSIESTVSQLKENVGYVFVDTRKPEEAEEPPTRMKNPNPLKPFEVIVNLFGIPQYREWDPTPIIAYSFAAFFGLMLCDVAYAIGIILAARFVIRIFVEDPRSEGYRLFQRVLYISGSVALVLGLLTGSYLGFESSAFVQSVRETLTSPISFIILSIALGLIHVNIAHVLALIGAARKRDRGTVVNKIALFALQLFGIPIILRWLFNMSLPVSPGTYTIFLFIVAASLVAIIVSSFMQRGGIGAIFWLFDVTGLLGDVMSYARLAGVGLATFYLAQSFNMLAGLLGGIIPGAIGVVIGAVMAVVVLILGHLLNLALGGITAFIHSLRLCFVEFLFKFYEGGGERYDPFRLKTRPVFVKEKA